ncbi:MAG TPA: hypothetical protein VNM71_04285 [Steroidobacteraceae bacterium]|nr:hypothetical protein [Steroidobacteraceae bacterium]
MEVPDRLHEHDLILKLYGHLTRARGHVRQGAVTDVRELGKRRIQTRNECIQTNNRCIKGICAGPRGQRAAVEIAVLSFELRRSFANTRILVRKLGTDLLRCALNGADAVGFLRCGRIADEYAGSVARGLRPE